MVAFAIFTVVLQTKWMPAWPPSQDRPEQRGFPALRNLRTLGVGPSLFAQTCAWKDRFRAKAPLRKG